MTQMRSLLLALILIGCSNLREGEFAGPFEGMAWVVDCSTTTLHELDERWEYESPNYCDAHLGDYEIASYEMCAEWMRIRYRYEIAKAEYREKCERHT